MLPGSYYLGDGVVDNVVDVEDVEVPVVPTGALAVHASHVLERALFQVGEDADVERQQECIQRGQSD